MNCGVTDFSTSRILWKSNSESFGLWTLEAKLTKIGEENKRIFLCTDVMAGNVYGEELLPKIPSYHYQAAFSTTGE